MALAPACSHRHDAGVMSDQALSQAPDLLSRRQDRMKPMTDAGAHVRAPRSRRLTIPGILTPVTGALLHEPSSIPVITNSARLIGVKPSA